MKKLVCLLLVLQANIVHSAHFSFEMPKSSRHVIIHFSSIPNDEEEHARWNKIIEHSLVHINRRLAHDGYINYPIDHVDRDDHQDFNEYPAGSKRSLWECGYSWLKSTYRSLFYRTHSIKYPKRENIAFFTRKDSHFGSYTMHIPDGVPEAIFIKYLKEIFAKKQISFHIDRDALVHVSYTPDFGLEGKHLTAKELADLKSGAFVNNIKNDKQIALFKRMEKELFWHHWFPTTGLRLKEPFFPPAYPYVPHYFSLWQLAPKKGAGIIVADIDTGVAAFSVEDDAAYRMNKDLDISALVSHQSFNLVSDDGLDPLEQIAHLMQPYIEESKFNDEKLKQLLPAWIKEYILNKNDKQIKNYLEKNGKAEIVTSSGQLSKKGKAALKNILTGPYGIVPRGSAAQPSFTVKKLIEPTAENVILELLPAPQIREQETTFIAGHGTHTFGLIAAKDTGNGITPSNDSGIVGLAPNAKTFMIKAFKDNGISSKSILIAGIKKAIMHNADIVNLSLKIADNLDLTEKSSQLLRRVVGAVPFIVSASGNNGDPQMPNYAGKVEAYPARFASVPFDVGSFSYKQDTAPISFFSQYEQGVGPLFVAPGADILSSGLVPGQTVDSEYVFMSGTSMATPIMSGFVTLMLAEFKNDFERDELLKVCYKNCLKMHDNNEWKTKVAFGALDMRTALFSLHVLKSIKNKLPSSGLSYDFKQSYDKFVQAVHMILLAPVEQYSKDQLTSIDFKTNFMAYFNAAQKNKENYNGQKYYIPKGNNALQDAIDNCVKTLFDALKTKTPTPFEKSIQTMFANTLFDLFDGLPKKIKERISKKDRQHPYWTKKALDLKKQLLKTGVVASAA